MNILIIEDNKEQIQFLYKKINNKYLDIKVVKSLSIEEALLSLKKYSFDLFFVDIILPDGSGFDFAKNLRSIPKYKFTPLVFCTTEYSLIVSAFKKFHCYDFLVKPFKTEEIYEIIDSLSEYNINFNKQNNIFLEIEKGINIKLSLNDINYIETHGKNITIFTYNNKYTLKNTSLNLYLDKLNCNFIRRCHKNYAVNINKITKIKKLNLRNWEISLKDVKELIYMSITYINEFKDVIK